MYVYVCACVFRWCMYCRMHTHVCACVCDLRERECVCAPVSSVFLSSLLWHALCSLSLSLPNKHTYVYIIIYYEYTHTCAVEILQQYLQHVTRVLTKLQLC